MLERLWYSESTDKRKNIFSFYTSIPVIYYTYYDVIMLRLIV